MSFQKYKTERYCVEGKHGPATKNIFGEITFNKKTGREIELIFGECVICNKKSTIVSNNTIQAENLGDVLSYQVKKD